MPDDKDEARIRAAATRLTEAVARRLTEADANTKAFLAEFGGATAGPTGRYALYRRQRCEAIYATFIEAAQPLQDKDGFPGSIHEITTQDEPAFLNRKPPIV
jgi:hypothetical protein